MKCMVLFIVIFIIVGLGVEVVKNFVFEVGDCKVLMWYLFMLSSVAVIDSMLTLSLSRAVMVDIGLDVFM